jgi:hypothetical protein
MKTATRPNNLETLEQVLQEDLQFNLSPIVPVQVQCRLKDGVLVILAQHAAGVMPDSQLVFSSLEQTVREQEWSDSESVKIYLRVEGQKQPYSFYSFKIEQRDRSTPTATPAKEMPDASDSDNSLNDEVEDESNQRQDAWNQAPASPHPWDQPLPQENSL